MTLYTHTRAHAHTRARAHTHTHTHTHTKIDLIIRTHGSTLYIQRKKYFTTNALIKLLLLVCRTFNC